MKNKKLISFILAVVIIVSSFAFSFVTYAKSLTIEKLLNDSTAYKYSITTDGNEDLALFLFTPDASGTYSFLSFNTRKSVGYLLTRDLDTKVYTTLAMSNSNDNYVEDGQKNSYQFRITYHLEAGTTYYLQAGWWSDNTISTTSATMNVGVRREAADDEDLIDHIEVQCDANLTWYTDGYWSRDANDLPYYHYNISKLIANMIVTIYYTDGYVSSSKIGSTTVDGYNISYYHDQYNTHWYSDKDSNYTGSNTLSVVVLNQRVDYNVVIEEGSLFMVKGKVVDYVTGEPINNATITISGATAGTTDADGNFKFGYSAGSYSATVKADNAIERNFIITIEANNTNNDKTDTPIPIAVGDYVTDGIINAKDFAYIYNTFTGDTRTSELQKFKSQINITNSSYPQLSI
jgi:hypothetical protein